jgi:hypothetical protein
MSLGQWAAADHRQEWLVSSILTDPVLDAERAHMVRAGECLARMRARA